MKQHSILSVAPAPTPVVPEAPENAVEPRPSLLVLASLLVTETALCAALVLSRPGGPSLWLDRAGCVAAGALLAVLVLSLMRFVRSHARATLVARLKPHAFFNKLTSAIALMRTDPDAAEALLCDAADLVRDALAERRRPG